jgi:aminodeoxyfutalosine deaminase
MGYQKFRADQLFDGYRLRNEDLALIATDDGMIEAIVPANQAGDDILSLSGILCPGFINCHCHLDLSHMKDFIPVGTGLVKFVSQIVLNRHATEEKILTAIANAESEMLKNGIVAVGDICNNTLTLSQKRKGRISYHNFIEASGFNPSLAQDRFDRAKTIYREYASYFPDAVSIVPHAPYSVSDELWQLIVDFPGNNILTIHNQESLAENELFLSKQGAMLALYSSLSIDASHFQPSGKTAFQSYYPKFRASQQVIFVHNVHTSADDLRNTNPDLSKSYWCLCPNANLYIGGLLPDVPLLAASGNQLVIGTDSLASNSELNILSELKTLRQNFPDLLMEQLLIWATSNGAHALNVHERYGSFEAGRQPGVVVIDNSFSSIQRLI